VELISIRLVIYTLLNVKVDIYIYLLKNFPEDCFIISTIIMITFAGFPLYLIIVFVDQKLFMVK